MSWLATGACPMHDLLDEPQRMGGPSFLGTEVVGEHAPGQVVRSKPCLIARGTSFRRRQAVVNVSESTSAK
jgi:hypothetical protein